MQNVFQTYIKVTVHFNKYIPGKHPHYKNQVFSIMQTSGRRWTAKGQRLGSRFSLTGGTEAKKKVQIITNWPQESCMNCKIR